MVGTEQIPLDVFMTHSLPSSVIKHPCLLELVLNRGWTVSQTFSFAFNCTSGVPLKMKKIKMKTEMPKKKYRHGHQRKPYLQVDYQLGVQPIQLSPPRSLHKEPSLEILRLSFWFINITINTRNTWG